MVRTSQRANYVAEVKSQNGGKVYASFAHQEQVVDGGELEVVASADHCPIAACRHPSRPIFTVQYHPEVVADVLDISFSCGEMSEEERAAYDDQRLTTDVGIAFGLSSH